MISNGSKMSVVVEFLTKHEQTRIVKLHTLILIR